MEKYNENYKDKKTYFLFVVVFSVCYGSFLSGLPIDAFMDRENYLNYVQDSQILIFVNASQGLLKLISNEPLWLLLNSFLYFLLESPDNVLRSYIFLFSTFFSFAVLLKGPKNFLWLIIFLFLPQVLKNYVIHLRQGVAIAIFFVGFNMISGRVKNILIYITPLIHASFFFVVLIYSSSKFLLIGKISNINRIILALIFSASIVASLNFLSRFVGARQADEYDFSASMDVSGIGFLFWMVILSLMLMENKFFIKKYFFEIFCLIFYLTAYFFVEVSGRIFESVIILVLVACLSLNGYRKYFFSVFILLFFVMSYIERFKLPQFGFGV